MLQDILAASEASKGLLAADSALPTTSSMDSNTPGPSPSASSPSPYHHHRYPQPVLPRSQQVDATLIDGAFLKVVREQLMGALVVEGGSTGLEEFDVIERLNTNRSTKSRRQRGGGGGTRQIHDGVLSSGTAHDDDDGDDEDDDDDTGSNTRMSGPSSQANNNTPRASLLRSYVYSFFAETLPFYRSRYQDEITLALRLVLFRMTVLSNGAGIGINDGPSGASMGDWLQNLTYRSEYSVRRAAVKAVIAQQQQRQSGSGGGASAAISSGSGFLSSSAALLYLASLMVSVLPSRLTTPLSSSSSSSSPSPIAAVNRFIAGQPLVQQQCYSPGVLHRLALGLATIVLPYVVDKLRNHALKARHEEAYLDIRGGGGDENSDGEGGNGNNTTTTSGAAASASPSRAARWAAILHKLDRIEAILSVLDLANTVVFFAQGRYRSLPERLLGLRLVTGNQKMQRHIGFDMMNQQLSYAVTLNFMALVAKVFRVRQVAGGLGAFGRGLATSAMGSLFGIGGDDGGDGGADGDSSSSSSPLASSPSLRASTDRCAICHRSPIVMPRVSTSCGHVYCYYCITSRLVGVPEAQRERDGVPCVACGKAVYEAVLPPRVKAATAL